MPITIEPISIAKASREKLDPRLAALVELDDAVFEPADAEAPETKPAGGKEATTGPLADWPLQRRSGPLAFLTAPRRWRGTFESASGHEAAILSHVSVFVTVSRKEALTSVALRAGGLKWRAQAGRTATTDVNVAQLLVLEEDKDVIAVEWTGGAKPLGYRRRRMGLSPRSALGLSPGAEPLDGSGVAVGIVDIEGIDIYHPAFVTDDGDSRILGIWDQTVDSPAGLLGAAPAPYGYGVAYDGADLRTELNPNHRERYAYVAHVPLKVSHGTMVAGVAAGSCEDDPNDRGVAPGTDIVFVNTRASGAGALAAMTEIAEAVDYVVRIAENRPCVINVSLGDNLGPHDGTSPVERFFDEICAERPGLAIVIAAGNSNESGVHVAGALSAEDGSASFVCEASRPSSRHAVIEIWYDAVPLGEEGLGVQITSPAGDLVTPVISADGLARAFDLGQTRLLLVSVKRYPAAEDALIRLEMFPRTRDGSMDVGAYGIRLLGGVPSRKYHAWLDHPFFKLRADSKEGGEPPPVTLTSPGTCKSAVTVGAWDQERGAPAGFSGRGPGRHGVDKPDVLACGVALRAPSAATVHRSHEVFTGTSAAAPLVTGALALAFEHAQRRGVRLSAKETKTLVRAAAAQPGAAGISAQPGPCRFLLQADGDLAGLFAAADIPFPRAG